MKRALWVVLLAALWIAGFRETAGAGESYRFSYSVHDPANSTNTIPQQACADRIREKT